MWFEWDDAQAETNVRKHDVTFNEATSVLCDPYARVVDDPDHSWEEERLIIPGMSIRARELVVSHCLRGLHEDAIRIISARKATRGEAEQ